LRDAGLLGGVWGAYEVTPYERSENGFLYSIIGIPDLDHDAAYSGHFINDGATLASGRERYRAETGRTANARFEALEQLHCGVVAARNIAQGEEIFVTYGASYWESRL